MANVTNQTFELTSISWPEQNMFRDSLGDKFTIKFMNGGICNLQSIVGANFAQGKWKDIIEDGKNYFILTLFGSHLRFGYSIISKDPIEFQLSLDGNNYYFKQKPGIQL